MKFWFAQPDMGRDIMIAEADSELHLEQALVVAHNQEVDEETSEFGKSFYKKVSSLKNSKYIIDGELSEEEYEENIDNEETMFYANNYLRNTT